MRSVTLGLGLNKPAIESTRSFGLWAKPMPDVVVEEVHHYHHYYPPLTKRRVPVIPWFHYYFQPAYVYSFRVPLQNVEVNAVVVDSITETTISQTYHNPYAHAMTCEYVFPVDDKACVSDFKVTVDGREIFSVCKEKIKARQEFHEAVAQGDTAYLVEQRSRDTFALSIGNIPALQTATIELTYVAELTLGDDGAAVKYIMPRSISPRYVSRESANDDVPSILSSMKHDAHPFKLTVAYEMTSNIQHISSTHDDLVLTRDLETPTQAETVLVRDGKSFYGLDDDVVINVKTSDTLGARLCIENNSVTATDPQTNTVTTTNSSVAMLTFVPIFEMDDDPKGEFVFLVDTSGSMRGKRMQDTKAALGLFLRSLPQDAYFNIVGFQSSSRALFQEPQMLTQSTLHQGIHFIDNLAAFGGTEILSALKTVFASPSRQDYPRSIFLLTDGSVSNTSACCDYITKELKDAQRHQSTRVFTLGMGSDCSRALVSGIAEAGKGVSAYVEDEDTGTKSTVIRLLRCASQPSFNSISVEWYTGEGNRVSVAGVNASLIEGSDTSSGFVERKEVRSLLGKRKPISQAAQTQRSSVVYNKTCAHQVPNAPPPIYDGEHFLMYCRMPEAGAHITHCVVGAVQSGGVAFEARVDVSEATVYDGDAIHRLSARALIRDIENGHGVWGDVSEKERKLEAVRLGVKYRIAGKYTSFVAVDKKQETDVPTYHEAQDDVQNHQRNTMPSKHNMFASSQPPSYSSAGGRGGKAKKKRRAGTLHGMAPMTSAPPPPRAPAGGGGDLAFAPSMAFGGPPPAPLEGAPIQGAASSRAYDKVVHARKRRGLRSISFDDDSEEEVEKEKYEVSKASAGSIRPQKKQQQQQQREFDEDLIISMQELDGSFNIASNIDKLSRAAKSKNLGTTCACPVSCENVTLWWTLVIIAMFKLIRVDTEDEWTMIISKSERWVNKISKQQGYDALDVWKRLANEGVKTAFGL